MFFLSDILRAGPKKRRALAKITYYMQCPTTIITATTITTVDYSHYSRLLLLLLFPSLYNCMCYRNRYCYNNIVSATANHSMANTATDCLLPQS